MKRSSLILFAFILTTVTLAQNQSSSNEIQFQFKPMDAISFSYLIHNSNLSAWRISADLSLGYNSSNSTSKSGNTSSPSYDYEWDSDYFQNSLRFTGQYLLYTQLSSKLKLFFGGGPYISYYRSKQKYENNNKLIQPNRDNYETINTSYGLGLLGNIGVNLDLSESILFVLEYSISTGYSFNYWKNTNTSSYQNVTSTGYNESEGNSWNFNVGGISLGIGIRF
jgi:outer membrane protein W